MTSRTCVGTDPIVLHGRRSGLPVLEFGPDGQERARAELESAEARTRTGASSKTHPNDKRIVRPTLRCLLDELSHEVGPETLKTALRSARKDMASDETYLFPCPLTEAQHLLLDKANLIAADAAAERERIAVISDRFAIKVKTSDRRAALCQDDRGTWWLLAAGHPKDDGSGDF